MTVSMEMGHFGEFLRRGTRLRFGEGTIDENGLHIDGQLETMEVACSDPYPLTGDELLQVPEGYRNHEVYQVFTEADFKNGDQITIENYGTFKIISVDHWPKYKNITIAASNL